MFKSLKLIFLTLSFIANAPFKLSLLLFPFNLVCGFVFITFLSKFSVLTPSLFPNSFAKISAWL